MTAQLYLEAASLALRDVVLKEGYRWIYPDVIDGNRVVVEWEHARRKLSFGLTDQGEFYCIKQRVDQTTQRIVLGQAGDTDHPGREEFLATWLWFLNGFEA